MNKEINRRTKEPTEEIGEKIFNKFKTFKKNNNAIKTNYNNR